MRVNENGEVVGLPVIRRWFDEPDNIGSNPGDGKAIRFKWDYDPECKCFVPSVDKPLDIYAMAQLYKDSCDLGAVIARVKAGDIGALNVRTGDYLDVCDAPRSLNELADFQNRVDESWNVLDPKVKEIFNNDFDKFSGALLNGSLTNVINDYIKSHAIVKEDNVNE